MINKLKKTYKKFDKYCNKKITIGYSIGMVLLLLIAILLIEVAYIQIRNGNTYFYEDIYGNRGNSNNCKKIDNDYMCERFVKVKWYVEE